MSPINNSSPMLECYYTDEKEEIICSVCNKKLGIANRRYKNMKFENGTFKHLLKNEEFEGSELVCKINDLVTNNMFYLCKEHYEKVFEIKEVKNKVSYPEIINELQVSIFVELANEIRDIVISRKGSLNTDNNISI